MSPNQLTALEGDGSMNPGLKQLYLQKPYVKETKKASLLATIYEEPVQKNKSKEPQLMAARGFKRFLDFDSQTEFAKRRRKREQKALFYQIQKQREHLAREEPETQVNACGRPKRRAASVSEAATKVMTFFDSPVKSIMSPTMSTLKESQDENFVITNSISKPKEIPVTKKRPIKIIQRVPKEVRDVVSHLLDVTTSVESLLRNLQ